MSDIPMLEHVLCAGEPIERCPKTGRIYERGHGALLHEEQTAMFVAEAQITADLPKPGEICPQTNRPYEISVVPSGWSAFTQTKTAQTARFLDELPVEAKADRQANFEKLRDVEPSGRA